MKPEPPREAADLARLLQLPAERELPGSRHQALKEYVMREIAQQQEERQQGEQHGETGKGRRGTWRLVGIGTPLVAAAAAVAVFAVTGGSGGGVPAEVGGSHGITAAAGAQAAQELGRIAAVADARSLPAVRDNQFVYVESKVAWEQDTQDSSGYHSRLQPLHLRQIWQSVDGSRAGLVRESGQDTALAGARGADGSGPSIASPDYRFLQSLPTDPSALLKLIYRETKGTGPNANAEAFTAIGDALGEQIAPPAVTAALYRAAAMIPGVYVVDDVVDVAGHHDLAVALNNPSAANEWLFDKSTLDYVGQQSVALKAGPLGPAGTIEGTQIILQRAIVDRPGEVPAAAAS